MPSNLLTGMEMNTRHHYKNVYAAIAELLESFHQRGRHDDFTRIWERNVAGEAGAHHPGQQGRVLVERWTPKVGGNHLGDSCQPGYPEGSLRIYER